MTERQRRAAVPTAASVPHPRRPRGGCPVRLPFTIWELTAGVCYRRPAAELPFLSLLAGELRRLPAGA
jgi:hypothetical protein